MKKNQILHIVCFFLLAFNYACEKADLQKSSTVDDVKIENRDVPDDCEDCPVDDCCCLVQMTQGSATLDLCGTSSPLFSTTACGPTIAGGCTISGYLLTTFLDASGSPSSYHFCMAKGTPFYIQSSHIATARITCQAGAANPQTVSVTFNTPGGKAYYSVNESCELVPCL